MTKLKALPLQTWLVLIVVLVSALGLSASAFAVNGIMRDFAYSNVDSKLQQASKSWLDRGEFQRPGATQQGPPSDFYVLKRFTDGTVLEVNDGSDAPDVSSVRFDERPTTVSSEIVVPHVVQNFCLAQHHLGVKHEVAQEVKFGW